MVKRKKVHRSNRKMVVILVLLAIIAVDVYLFRLFTHGDKAKRKATSSQITIPINQQLTNSMSDLEGTERFDRSIENFLSKWELKGASFALMRGNKLVYAKGYGYANVLDNEKCEVKHLFRIASVSKLITAIAIMKLREDGRLKLNDKVFGESGILNDSIFTSMLRYKESRNITVEHLLRHKGGFSQRLGDPMFNMDVMANTLNLPLPLKMDDMVRYAAQCKLKFKPGSSSSYSNLGYLVLSKVIEKVSGEEYEQYVKRVILDPIGCYDMYLGENQKIDRKHNEVCYYEVHDAEPVEAFDGSGLMVTKSNGGNDIKGLYGAGGWIASPVELLKVISAIDNVNSQNNILSRESISLMTRYSKSDLPIGWAKVTSRDEWLRTGTFSGTSALIKHQSNNFTWVFVTNTSSWKGAYFTSYINKSISDAVSRVKSWPDRDLFTEMPILEDYEEGNNANLASNR